ncbi:DBH-like monooxygenase protein 1 [Palaemon carinicauda]|uniref:DBH-like monooxygenase protein 1 n=1 Tax=Palaemon carinicauda TaxID=392227 RepID=UPI0035B59BE2
MRKMGYIVTTTVVLVVITLMHVRASPMGSAAKEGMVHRTVLDTEANYVLLWTPRERDIIFEVHVATTGYVGLGFSPSGGMKGADIILGWVNDLTGEVILHDRYAPGYGIPIIDKTQDVELIEGYQNDTHTVLKFSRLWDSCDDEDYKITDDTVRIIWAYNYMDPEGEMDMMIHHKRGTKSMYLNESPFTMRELPDDVKTFDVVANNARLPNTIDTIYWCKIYKIPSVERKAQIIGFVPLIQKENIEHVHHMVLYECHLPDSEIMASFLDIDGAQCHTKNMPPSWKYCSIPLIAWAIGSEGEMYPEHVGFPIGEEHGGFTYFMMEIHYDNPNLRQDVVDNSGLRVFYTEKVRKYDAGNVALGHNVSPTLIVPPGQKWLTVGHCASECTEFLPPGGLNVFHGMLHSHLLGSSLRLRHIRNGVELPRILEDKTYDFNFQQNRVLKNEVNILPGDHIIMECGYDSTKLKTPTYGGLTTNEEMCLGFLAYYPRIDFMFCGSNPPMKNIYESVGFEEIYSMDDWSIEEEGEEEEAEPALNPSNNTSEYEELKMWLGLGLITAKSPEKYDGMTLLDVFDNASFWLDSEWISQFQNITAYGEHRMTCGRNLRNTEKKRKWEQTTINYPNFIPLEENAGCSSQ